MGLFLTRFNGKDYTSTLIDSISNYSETFDALDSIQNKNLFRVYQHKLFCDNYIKDKCVFNNKQNIFTVDRSHPSSYVGNLIVEEILEKLELN